MKKIKSICYNLSSSADKKEFNKFKNQNMYRINEILNKIGIEGPESKYWPQLDEKFRESYQEFLNMQKSENIDESDIKKFDDKLCIDIYNLHDFDEDEEESKDENENQDIFVKNVDEPETEKEIAEEKIEESKNYEKEHVENKNKNEKETNDMKKQIEQPEIKIEKTEPPIKQDIETPEQIIEKAKKETVTESSQKKEQDTGPIMPEEKEIETTQEPDIETPVVKDEYPELTAYLQSGNTKVSAKTLNQCALPRELWNENMYEFIIGNHTFRKTGPGDLLFNQWTVFKNTNTGL